MRIFDHPNLSNDWKCPICHTNDNDSVTLISVAGTEKGNNTEAEQVHIKCINPMYFPIHHPSNVAYPHSCLIQVIEV